MGASAAKLLVYYHPEAPNAADQERLVADVAADCRAADLALFVEPLSFSLVEGERLTGEARRRVVIETARRLTAIGGDILKAEFPYDPSVTDRAAGREACAELDAASAVPWVLLSGGVDDATFEAQVADRLRGRVRAACSSVDPCGPRPRRWSPRHGTRSWPRRHATGSAGSPIWSTGPAGPGTSGRTGWRPRRCRATAGIGSTERDHATERDIDVLVVGEINPDIVIADPDPVPVFGEVERVVGSIGMTVGSSSAIFACGAARLGLRIAFCGVVGDDAFGRFMLDAMAERGIDVSACVVDPHRPTGATVILTSGRDRAMLTAWARSARSTSTRSRRRSSPGRDTCTWARSTSRTEVATGCRHSSPRPASAV